MTGNRQRASLYHLIWWYDDNGLQRKPTWPTTTGCFRPGAGASTSDLVAVKTSMFSRMVQRVSLSEILSSG
jgi:hypothetical protein